MNLIPDHYRTVDSGLVAIPRRGRWLTMWVLALLFVASGPVTAATDPLPSWNSSSSKQQIINFVKAVSTKGSKDFVPVAERIATFDNDGTLWSEQPMYFQLFFAFDRVKQLAASHPQWKTEEPYASIIKGDIKGALAGGSKPLLKVAGEMHAGVTDDEFRNLVSDWFRTARHPKTRQPYNLMVFQPMLELLDYLRAHGFKTFIVSGGGIDFLRVFAEQAYGIPPEQVVGSSLKASYEIRDGVPVIVKQPELAFVDDKEGKPVGIYQHIGRRPIFAAGNSDGDFQMLEWTTAGKGPRFGLLIHHTDAGREWAYDRDSHIGKLARGLDEGPGRGWTIVDMKEDWKVIFPFDKP